MTGREAQETVSMRRASAGCASSRHSIPPYWAAPSPRGDSRKACVTLCSYYLHSSHFALASLALLPLVQAIIRPSATNLCEEGLRIWLLAIAFPFSAIADRSFAWLRMTGREAQETISMLRASAGCASSRHSIPPYWAAPSPRGDSRKACVTLCSYYLHSSHFALASLALLLLAQAIIRPSATFLREEGLRIWLLPRLRAFGPAIPRPSGTPFQRKRVSLERLRPLRPLPPLQRKGVNAMNGASVKRVPTTDYRLLCR